MNEIAQPRMLPRAILVVGDGQVGILTAIALRSALPTTKITVAPAPLDMAAFADSIGTAMPFTNRLHDRLGIDELDIVRKAGGSHRLVTRYCGWAGPSREEVNGYGGGGPVLGNAFTGHFEGARNPGQDSTKQILSPAAALAANGRFCPPDGSADSPLSAIDYALRWNVAAYRDLLISKAMEHGVEYAPELPVDVLYGPNGDISEVVLANGAGAIAADLFIDCSGPSRWLMSKMRDVAFDSWVDYLPCDRVLIAAPGDQLLALEDRMTLTSHGWLSEIIGRDGLRRIFAFPASMDMTQVEQRLVEAGAASAVGAVIVPGALEKSFVGNVIALGDAAASFEPIGGANLDLAHRQLSLLLELIPAGEIEPRERDEYNRRTGLMAVSLRDWLASHYIAPGIVGTPFAEVVAQLKRSPSLALLIGQHKRHGRLPFFEESPMLAQEWSAMLRALGVASSPSATALAQPEEQNRLLAKQAEDAARAAVDAAPPYVDWLNWAQSLQKNS